MDKAYLKTNSAVIFTALPVEYKSVAEHLSNLREQTHRKGTVYERGHFSGPSGLWEVAIVEIGMGQCCAALEAERAISYFNPSVALFVGIAGGLKDVALGDVVAATKVYGYESGKAGEIFSPRPNVGNSSYSLEQRARAEAKRLDWIQRIKNDQTPRQNSPKAYIGPIAAGSKVVASTRSEVYAYLKAQYGDALAIEMEGRGFLQALHANPSVSALIVRGISDLIDHKAEADAAQSQLAASRNASAFAFQVLSSFSQDRTGESHTVNEQPRPKSTPRVSPTSAAQSSQSAKSALDQFLSNYGIGQPPAQAAEQSDTDNQLKNISLSIAQDIAATQKGTLLDIGSGSGIVLKRLAALESFKTNSAWLYIGVDETDLEGRILQLGVDLRVHRRVEFLSLATLYSRWLSTIPHARPLIVIIRNVFHELDIEKTATLLHALVHNLQPGDTLYIQDLQVLPEAERGNACWHLPFFAELIGQCGFVGTYVDEPTARGNRWFTLVAPVAASSALHTFEHLRGLVLEARTKQYQLWITLDSLVPGDFGKRDNIAYVDLDLQIAALQMQLLKAKAPGVTPPTPEREAELANRTFSKHLFQFDTERIRGSLVELERPAGFRDRARGQDALEQFLNGTSPLAILAGAPFMGKSYLVQEVLSRRASGRQAVVIDLHHTSSAWNVLEQYLAGIGCLFPYEVVSLLKTIRLEDISDPLTDFISRVSKYAVITFDHFERITDPNGELTDLELQQLLKLIICATEAKVIITTRRDPVLPFLPRDVVIGAQQPPVGRFPEGKHVENVIGDFLSRAGITPSEYPPQLLVAIDRYPYLAALAGRVIASDKTGSNMVDPDFLVLLRKRLRDDLLRRIVTDAARPAVGLLSLLRTPVPREMFAVLADREALEEAERLGLLYSVFERSRKDLVTGVSVLRAAY